VTFVWSALPATFAGIVLGALAWRAGGFNWIVAAAAGVIAFAVAAVLFPIGFEDARPFLAFLAGLTAIAVREFLILAGVLQR
jgi:hypothetical protein